MTYFKIGNKDYSMYVNQLKITTNHTYNAQINAHGDTVVDYVNAKRTIDVGIIPLDADILASLLEDVQQFSVSLSFLNPNTNTLEQNVLCIIPENNVEYYTIRSNNTSLKAFTLTFVEL